MRLFPLLSVLVSAAGVAQAQLFTSTLPFEDGNTVLVSRYTNAAGAYAYTTVSVLNGAVAAPTTALTVTTTPAAAATETTAQRGPVGNVQSVLTTAKTTFTYTTTDAAGEKVVRTAIFTPSFAPTGTPAAVQAGTVLQYSDYTKTVEPALQAQASELAASASAGTLKLATSNGEPRAFGLGALVVGGVALGAGGWVVGLL